MQFSVANVATSTGTNCNLIIFMKWFVLKNPPAASLADYSCRLYCENRHAPINSRIYVASFPGSMMFFFVYVTTLDNSSASFTTENDHIIKVSLLVGIP